MNFERWTFRRTFRALTVGSLRVGLGAVGFGAFANGLGDFNRESANHESLLQTLFSGECDFMDDGLFAMIVGIAAMLGALKRW